MLEHLRETAQLTQRELAAKAGVTQETLSQLETGKVVRPRLDTLTKLCSALELGNMRPEDLLDPRPMEADEEINHATTRLVTLLKVLPSYNFRHSTTAYYTNPFWDEFGKHLGYSDDYPARKIASKLERAAKDSRLAAAADLAAYTLMFFDPSDTALIQILADNGNLGSPPGTLAARLWCRDLVEAAWTIHRATITSYPKQVGELVAEATTTKDPERLAELGMSVYDVVRGPALARASADVQISALREDPSSEVHYEIAKTAPIEVQRVAADLPQAWIGLCTNTQLAHDIATPLLDTLIAALPGPHGDTAGQAILELAERPDMPRPLLEHIAELVKDPTDDPTQDRWLTTIWQYIGDTLKSHDELDQARARDAQARRAKLHLVEAQDPTRHAWWSRFLRK